MTAFRSDFLRVFQERGFLYQATDLEALDAAFAKGPVTSYWGMDATADSLHVGSLVGIMANRWLQKTGHKPILLIGGGTTKIGDPSGRDESRQLISNETIANNAAGIRRSLAPFIDLERTQMVDNAEWLDQLQYIPFLREVGRHFSINRMLSMDSVKLRLEREQPLSFLEFNYMILQAYDFVELYKRYGVNLQIGGSDQWGNIVSGTDLGRRLAEADLYGLTWPLLATASGAKMGKSAQGAIWLNADRLGPYDYWQYWRNTEDADVERFLKLFTELPLDEVARLAKLQGAEINEAKKVLATEATALAHGRAAAEEAAETARRTFEEGAATGEALPSTVKSRSEIQAGISVVDLLAELGLAASKGEARRLIKGGGVRLNDVQVSDEAAKLTEAALDRRRRRQAQRRQEAARAGQVGVKQQTASKTAARSRKTGAGGLIRGRNIRIESGARRTGFGALDPSQTQREETRCLPPIPQATPIVIAGAARTPLGKFQGELSSLAATELGTIAIKAALERAQVSPDAISEVLMGCVLPAGLGQAPARQAARLAGIPDAAGATTINKVCGSGMKAAMFAHDLLKVGSADIVVAGGMESMTKRALSAETGSRRLSHRSRPGVRPSDVGRSRRRVRQRPLDGHVRRRLRRAVPVHQRAMQDEYAMESVSRARKAQADGAFDREIVKISIADKKGTIEVARDEHAAKLDPRQKFRP